MTISICLNYDVPNWANHSAVKALAQNLHHHAPGRFDITLAPVGSCPPAMDRRFDIFYASAF